MKKDVLHLATIARKKTRQIIGLMSGTSLDGLDVAWCEFSGSGTRTKVKVIAFKTIPYEEVFKLEIRRVFAKQQVDFQHLTLLNAVIAEHHASIILDCLTSWGVSPSAIDLIASHGQTVFHAPKILHHLPQYPNATLQIGDGDHLAVRTGIITVSDFRQKHVAAGGEGAPLALYGDYFLFSKPGKTRVLLNIGGIANFTFLPADGDTENMFATDTGPGNTLLDLAAREHFGVPYDKDALLAERGIIDENVLDTLKSDPFFAQPFPKTTGPELFGSQYLEKALASMPKGNINPYNLMATLTQFTVDTIVDALHKALGNDPKCDLYLSGGGAHNPLIVNGLKKTFLNMNIQHMQSLGIHGDAKEAVLFAALANETVAGSAIAGARLGGIPLVSMGKISFPG